MRFDQLYARIREFFLLENRERRILAIPEGQRQFVRLYDEAAKRRLHVARDVRGPQQTSVALELYRQGAILRMLSVLVFEGESLDVSSIDRTGIVEKFVSRLEAHGTEVPPEFARVRPLMGSTDLLESDRLVTEEAERRAQDFEVVTQWLGGLVDSIAPRELRWVRFARIGVAAGAVVAILIAVVATVLAPTNLAKGKHATSSSTMGGTVPSGAVDGSHTGAYDFHSSQEDSPWLAIDLGAPHLVNRVKIYGRRDAPYDQSIPLALESSDDGVSYRPVAQRTEPFTWDSPWIVAVPAFSTRFVRLRTMRHSYLVVNEVEVYGPKAR